MRNLSSYIILTVWFGCAMILSSCGNDDNASDEETEHAMLSIVMRGAPTEENNSGEGEYDKGTTAESYISFNKRDYRVLFFDTNDKYLGRCEGSFAQSSTSDYTEYQFTGAVPDTMLTTTDFKIVVLANWGNNYDDDGLKVGETTINQLCEKSWSMFSCDANTTKNILKGAGIPFFGVRTFKGVTFTKYGRTTLSDPITLLRAMAKVEVMKKDVDESNSYNITSVTLTNYNTKGYCAPLVTERSDYDHDYTWSEDFVKDLHLVSDAESTGSLSFCEDNGKWVIYIPEYRNLTEDGTSVRTDGKEAFINVKFDFQKDDEDPYVLYFADYENSQVGTRHNIERNNLYRYILNYASHRLLVEAGEWTDVFDNTIEFKK